MGSGKKMIHQQSVFEPWAIEYESVQAVICSPPYYALRKYSIPDVIIGGDKDCKHEWEIITKKAGGGTNGNVGNNIDTRIHYESQTGTCIHCNAWKGQYGLEPTPAAYVEHTRLWAKEAWRVLRNDGVFFLNIADSYPSGGVKAVEQSKPKCQLLIPHRVAIALVDDGWTLRNTIIWFKGNAMPESVTDRFSKKYEYIFMFTKQEKYYFDLASVSIPTGATNFASFGSSALIPKTNATILADNSSFNCWGFLDFRQPQITINDSMTFKTEGFKILKLVGINIGIEIPKGKFMMNMEKDIAFPTSLANMFISLKGKFPLYSPIMPLISDLAASPCGAILSTSMDAHVDTHTLLGAKIMWLEGAFVSGNFFIARITLCLNNINATLFVWTSFCSSHNVSFLLNDTNNIIESQTKNPGDVWQIPTQPSSEKHFAMWPERLVERMVKCSTKAGDTVLDCFAGSGTTLKVAEQLHRKGVGIDLGYHEMSNRRTSKIQKSLFV